MEARSTDIYQSISHPSEGLYRERGSRFIALAFPIRDEAEISPILDDIRRKYHDARHHCYAWRLGIAGEPYRVNDDGEPSGSAGRPIHGQMLSMELSDVLVVVVRYFGGVKLGVSGLINAYRQATREALNNSTVCTRELRSRFELDFAYPRMNDVMRFIREEGLDIESNDFAENCRVVASARNGNAERIKKRAAAIYGMECRLAGAFVYDPK